MQQLSLTKFTAIVLGDFNINMMKDKDCLQLADQYGFRALITEPTTIKGSLLDQVFINLETEESNLKVEILPSYFSDHHLITVCLQKNS